MDKNIIMILLLSYNEGFATQYFTLKKGAHHGDPISEYLFIIALEVLFTLIKNKDSINGIGL